LEGETIKEWPQGDKEEPKRGKHPRSQRVTISRMISINVSYAVAEIT
jgi:hypothetical protein